MEIQQAFSNFTDEMKIMMAEYLSPDKIGKVLVKATKIILIIILARLVIRITNALIDKFIDNRDKVKLKLDESRINTAKGVLKSITRYTIYFIALVPILAEMNIDIKSIIAAAGIGGLAIGFGAQNLVKDIITGFFILFEDQFAVGDYIEIEGKNGVVEEMALRITKIRDFSGDLHIIPNGAITKVTNRCRGNMRAKVDMSIAYEENIERAINVLKRASESISKENNDIIEGPIVLGVTSFGASDVIITIIAKVKPMSQWEVERIMRKRFKEVFDEEGIEIPYPKRVVYNENTSE
ncbi:mechanosensitive ion channel family protein [Maledivibacter halophilus]|uniref:Small conductance mechanosensitive channel n=1 Tax=Maledivibacter halophilus TaxID=36842 RepID=A0A1T5MJ84_9FIRM|nr:mechanosensitive ion channel family protein [Maledivibacter halophilus]SKC88297.1 small conductance mechanosensitive channel [Maledivibacter halophilus]